MVEWYCRYPLGESLSAQVLHAHHAEGSRSSSCGGTWNDWSSVGYPVQHELSTDVNYFNLCLGYPDSGIQWFQGWTPVPSLSQRFPSSGSWISMRHSMWPHHWMCLSKTSYNVSCQHIYLQSLFELLDIVYVFQDTAIAKANVRRGVSLAWSKYGYDKAWCPYDILRHEGMAVLVYMAC